MHRNTGIFAGGLVAGLVALTATLAFPGIASADLTGLEVMQNLDKKNRAQDEQVKGTMEIFFANGKRSLRQLHATMKANLENDDDNTLMRFTAPTQIAGTGLLTVEDGDSDDQWLYLHDLRKSKRLAGASKSERFVDSDMANYDMRTEDLKNHAYELMGTDKKKSTVVEGGEVKEVERDVYVVNSKPLNEKTTEESGYSSRTFFVDKERWVPLEIRFNDKNGKPLKIMTCKEYAAVKDLWRTHRVEVINVQEKTRTLILYKLATRMINEGVAEEAFSKRELERY